MEAITYGRFVLEQDADRVRLRVRTSDTMPWLHAASLVPIAFVALLPQWVFSFTSLYSACAVAVALLLYLLGLPLFGRQVVLYAASARSRYSRVRREVEARCPLAGGPDGAFRIAAGGPTLNVDGRAFGTGDFAGVVVAGCTEAFRTGKGARHFERYRPTLVMRDCLYELDVFEAADEPDAHELGNAMATALSGQSTKAPVVRWTAPDVTTSGPWDALYTLASVATPIAVPLLAWSHLPFRLNLVSGVLCLFGTIHLASCRSFAQQWGRERSRRAGELLASAHATLTGAA